MGSKGEVVTIAMFQSLEKKFKRMSAEIRSLKKEMNDLKSEKKELKTSIQNEHPGEEVDQERKLRSIPKKSLRLHKNLKDIKTNFRISPKIDTESMTKAIIPEKAYVSCCDYVNDKKRGKMKKNGNYTAKEPSENHKSPSALKQKQAPFSTSKRTKTACNKSNSKVRSRRTRKNSPKNLNKTETSENKSTSQKGNKEVCSKDVISVLTRKPLKPNFQNVKSRIDSHWGSGVPKLNQDSTMNSEENKELITPSESTKSGISKTSNDSFFQRNCETSSSNGFQAQEMTENQPQEDTV
ncbi:unnamed protein product [Moneuplotes crassus]|uniref:Uncharacterized protein n=1 Tax=Euplotes crassus TaxID=5936 RepID=A0AAD1UKS2_EUPCR|nr:unnamed protein product [Moneuplotes crassus]